MTVLSKTHSSPRLLSTMISYEKRVTTVLHAIKHNTDCEIDPVVPIRLKRQVVAHLRAVTALSIRNPDEIRLFAKWRKQSQAFFPTQFRVTRAGTAKWAREQLLEKKDRVLFMIEDVSGRPLGHVGLNRFDFTHKSCEIDNIIRGEAGIPGLMTEAIAALCAWGGKELGVKTYYLQCLATNKKAIALYKRCGFKKVEDLDGGMIRMKKV